MAVIIEGDNILSALGETTAENISNIKSGISGIKRVEGFIPSQSEAFMLSRIDCGETSGRTLEERMIFSVSKAISSISEGEISSSDTIFVFSTTKGDLKSPLWKSAEIVTEHFNNPNRPVVISNACISGVVAIIVAKRLMDCGLYKRAIVVGADEVSRFIVAGFGCLKALSSKRCRPFDIERDGLNLGEAIGTLVLKLSDNPECENVTGFVEPQVVLAGAITNDANHISGPSRTAEGLFRAIGRIHKMTGRLPENKGFINPHGTATIYNDQMESIGIARAGLDKMRVNPLKSYYGHTLGAAGVIETILSAHFADEGFLPQPLGYEVPGTDPILNIHRDPERFEADWFLKLVSGFGGTNAAIEVVKASVLKSGEASSLIVAEADSLRTAMNGGLFINKNVSVCNTGDSKEFLNGLYRSLEIRYPKFHKMDLLCKGGIIAMHQLIGSPEDDLRNIESDGLCGKRFSKAELENTALVFLNSSSSKAADDEFFKGISDENFYPSPSVFVYTLPSVVIVEVSILYKFYGEGTFFIADKLCGDRLLPYIKRLFTEGATSRLILCWDEVTEDKCQIAAALITASATPKAEPLTEESLDGLCRFN